MSHVADREYWERQLAGCDFVCASFPDLTPDEPVATDRRGRFDFSLCKETADRLLGLSNGSDYALFTLLLTGLRQLLFRYTGQRAIAIGTSAFAAEPDPQIQNRLLVLASEVSPGESFKDALQREREIVLGAKQHQNLPVAHALAAMNVAYAPECFGVFLGLNNVQHPSYAELERPATAFVFERRAAKIYGTVSYASARYEPSYVAQIVTHLDTLLLAGCSKPSAPFTDHILLAPAERSRLLTEFSRRAQAAPSPSTIVAEFEAQVALAPERIALSCDGETLSYAELNHRANHVARWLCEAGTAPEEPVALYLTRSIEAVIGMLGILKAGAAYLPLDPSSPPARNRFMIEDAGVRTVLATSEPPEPDRFGAVRWIRLDAARDPLDRHAPNIRSGIGAESIAYVLYTSGTTGKPKGVQIPHRGVVQLVKDSGFVRMTSDEIFLSQAALTFDASALEIWGSLLNGARLVICTKLQPTLDDLAQAICGGPVNCLLQTTALFHLTVDEQRSLLLPVRQLMVGGDVLSVRHARDLLSAFSGRLWNIYGPTENSVVSTAHVVTASDLHRGSISIGRPVGATEVYILDDALRPVPVGVTGEIYLAGAGLARGYLNRPALTAERFLPHLFSLVPGARLYRSGDFGRFLPDGAIEFNGRADGQIKIRGFRVELGEIESLLCEQPAVKAAAVIVATDTNGTKRLVAFVVAREGSAPTGRELQDFIRQRAPEYEIPAAFVFRDELPLNRSGKIDRSLLLRLGETETIANSVKEPARTLAERAMAAIWNDVLHREDIGVRDDFFELGGDSLLAMQVLARINKSGLHLPARQFFREPTITACALAAKPRTAVATTNKSLPQGTVPLTPVQRWFFETYPEDPHFFNLSALFDVKDAIEPTFLAKAAWQVVRHHDAFLLTFLLDSTGWTSCYAPPPRDEMLFTTVDLSSLSADTRSLELENRARIFQESLNLSEGPLIRFVYFHCGGGGRDRLLVVVHHLVIDAVSWRILLDDLETVLGQLRAGQKVQLPRQTDRFGVWASQLPAYLDSEAAQQGRKYWLQDPPAFAAASFPLPLADTPRATCDVITHTFTVEETRGLLRVLPAVKATMEELLLAALLLHHCISCGTSNFSVTLDRHGRSESIGKLDVSRTIGWFTAIFPVYLTLGPETSFAAALAVVKETLGRIPNRGVDFGLLCYLGKLEERGKLAAFPQPEIGLNYQGEFDHALGRSSYFTLSADSFGAQQSVRHAALHALEIDALIVEEKLTLLCSYDPLCFHRERAVKLIANIAATLGRQSAHRDTGRGGDALVFSDHAVSVAGHIRS